MVDLDLMVSLGSSTLFEASGIECLLDPDIRTAWAGAAIAGPAYPVRCAPYDNLAIQLAMEHAPEGSVLVVDAHGSRAGFWGEVLTVAAQARGVRGLVIDGGVRDIAAMRRLGFPAFSRHVCCRGTIKNAAPSVGREIVMGGVAIAPGDYVCADEDGIVVLPQAEASRIVAAGQQRAEKEDAMMQQLKAGKTMVELLGLEGKRALVL